MTDIKKGRPTIDTPRNRKLTIRLTENEFLDIEKFSKKLNISKTSLVLKGVSLVKEQTKNNP